ncbi:MAG: glycosyltransferase family 2 protein [bacterium]
MQNFSLINFKSDELISQITNGFPSRVTKKNIPPTTPGKKPWPKITIVTASFNMVDYIEETILSVIGQEYPNLEYIIIDGGSKDATVDIIKKYELYLTYWISEPDNGLYDALQKGFRKATGDIMAYINSDDKYYPNAFFSIATIFSEMEDVEWVLGRATFYNDEGTTVDVKDLKIWSKFNYYLGDYEWIQQESIFWRRSLWLKAGSKINANLKLAGDYELWLRFFSHAKLYSTQTIFAGFRFRTKDQLSLEKIDSYKYEIEQVTNLETLPREDKYAIKKIRFLQKIFKIPFMNRIKTLRRHYEKIFAYPPKIVYDFYQRKFFKNYY